MKTLTEWLDYIALQHTPGILLGLERIQSMAIETKLTQFACPVIMVAGTNGKGSVVTCLEQIYLAAGFKVGAYTSPHLHQFSERIRINGQPVEDNLLIEAFNRIAGLRGEKALSFFEYTTLAALLIFQACALDVLILEVGLGGRLDAVNVVEPDVSVVTSIGLDHTDWLGNDREQIAREKAGIFRMAKPAVIGDPMPPSSLLAMANVLHAPHYVIGVDFQFQRQESHWSWQSGKQHYTQLPLPTILLENASSSLKVIDLLQQRLPVSKSSIEQGLSRVYLPGRFEIYHQPQLTILDVAHNAEAAAVLAQRLRSLAMIGKIRAVLGMLSDKPIAQTIAMLQDQVDEWYLCDLSKTPRGAKSVDLAIHCAAQGIKSCYNHGAPAQAYQSALQASESQADGIVVFGSFHTVADVRSYLEGRQGL